MGQMGQMGRSCIPHSLLLSVPSSCFVFNVTPSGLTMWVQLCEPTPGTWGEDGKEQSVNSWKRWVVAIIAFLLAHFAADTSSQRGEKKVQSDVRNA